MDENISLENILIKRGYTVINLKKSVVGHFEIEAKINGKRVLMLLDTGASKSVLDYETANTLNLLLESESNCGGGLGTSEAAVNSSIIEALTIGSIVINSFPLYIMDFSHPIKSIQGRGGNKIDGVIGSDILEPRSAIIEYKESKLYLK